MLNPFPIHKKCSSILRSIFFGFGGIIFGFGVWVVVYTSSMSNPLDKRPTWIHLVFCDHVNVSDQRDTWRQCPNFARGKWPQQRALWPPLHPAQQCLRRQFIHGTTLESQVIFVVWRNLSANLNVCRVAKKFYIVCRWFCGLTPLLNPWQGGESTTGEELEEFRAVIAHSLLEERKRQAWQPWLQAVLAWDCSDLSLLVVVQYTIFC